MCRCWPASPAPCATARRSRTGCCRRRWSGCGVGSPEPTTAIARWSPFSPPCSPTDCRRWKPPAPRRSPKASTFARGYGRPLRMPSALDVGAEPEQRLAFAWAYAIRGHYAEGIELVLEPSLLFQALVPTPLQFSGNQSVVGIDGVILPSGVRRFETRLLDRQFNLPALLGVFAPARPQSRQRRLDAQRLNTLDHLRGNRTVDTKTAEGDA